MTIEFPKAAIDENRKHTRQAGVSVILPMKWRDEISLILTLTY
ncbi:hypothetical protein V7137_10680 [Neobacillus drentensis]